jgi:tRNA C32,U32 (ribose-2'-O)-methylase TrmJ
MPMTSWTSRTECASLGEAVRDCGLVMGTTARPGLYRQHARTPREWAPLALAAAETTRVALVFGQEDNGLPNEDLALCTQIIQIPTSALCLDEPVPGGRDLPV